MPANVFEILNSKQTEIRSIDRSPEYPTEVVGRKVMLALDCFRKVPDSNERTTKPCKQVKDAFAMETDAAEGRDFTLVR